MNNQQNLLPKGWEIKTIGDVCISASSNVSQNKLADDEGDFPIFGASGLIKNVSFYHQDKPYLSIVKDGSGVGRVTKMDAFTSIIGTLQYILPKENINLDYLNYSLMSVDFKKYVAGAAIPHIYFKDYKNEPFLWMPLPEQQRIVSILDEAFAAIAKAKANAEQNLRNAKELFESFLQGVFKNGDWEKKELRELTTILGDGLHGTPEYSINGEYYFINGNNLNDGKIEFKDNTKRVNVGEFNKYKKNLTDRTILVSINGTLGNVAFYNNEKIILGKSACYFNLKENIDKSFVKYVLSSPYFIKYAHKEATGATIKNVSLKSMREFKVPFPNFKEQQTIVNQLDALRAETQKLEAVYRKKIADLEELKKSLLQKAFSGEL
ncbi:MAG: restriction endonuclease subunit S [Paludibacteraceae bacterium]|nr:restriction endonuclease subunit S [Paludibacteraceae bacterium]